MSSPVSAKAAPMEGVGSMVWQEGFKEKVSIVFRL